MARRIEVELTSERDDNTWTWRAAGARQPKGVLDGSLLYPGAKVGDVVRAEAEFDVDGITVISVLPPKQDRKEEQRLELLPPSRDVEPVTTTLVSRRGEGRDRRRDRRPGDTDRDARRGRPGPPDGDRRPRGDRPDRPDSERRDRPDRPDRPDRGERPDRGDRPGGPDRGARGPDRRPRPAAGDRRPRPERPAPEPKPKAKRLRPGKTHRSAVMADLPPEQRPVAEQLLSGGIPAVRQALERQNEQLRSEGKPEVRADALLAMAEELHPRLRAAEWRDRAEAALAEVDEVDLRDLRSVVVAADDAARDEEARQLAAQLRDAVNRRVDREHAEWQSELAETVAAGRVVRALRLSSRPPKAGVPLPADLATRLAEQASAALTAEVSQDRWAAVLDALAFSPVRRSVQPQGFPAEPGEELLAAVRKVADRLPELAARFGVEAPARPARPGRPAKKQGRQPVGRPAGGGGTAPRRGSGDGPPRPQRTAEPAGAPAAGGSSATPGGGEAAQPVGVEDAPAGPADGGGGDERSGEQQVTAPEGAPPAADGPAGADAPPTDDGPAEVAASEAGTSASDRPAEAAPFAAESNGDGGPPAGDGPTEPQAITSTTDRPAEAVPSGAASNGDGGPLGGEGPSEAAGTSASDRPAEAAPFAAEPAAEASSSDQSASDADESAGDQSAGDQSADGSAGDEPASERSASDDAAGERASARNEAPADEPTNERSASDQPAEAAPFAAEPPEPRDPSPGGDEAPEAGPGPSGT